MTPTQHAEARVQIEHAARVQRRLRLPNEREHFGLVLCALICCLGVSAAVVIGYVLAGAAR